jgi:deoxycytidylate deaminase
MAKSEFEFDWGELAFGNKSALKNLKATFIAAPREISTKRFTQFVKDYLPKGNVVLGVAKEPYILGFEDQPQFRTLQMNAELQKLIDKVNAASTKHKIYVLNYFQRELKYILDKGGFRHVVLVNGSWKYVFHSHEEYYVIANKRVSYEYVSPFVDEAEAIAYNDRIYPEMLEAHWAGEPVGTFTEDEILALVSEASKLSFDYSFQCGVVLAKKAKKDYEFVAVTFNKVVPYQTYALHYGASREKNFSVPHDLNHYDTVHAEVAMIIRAATEGIDLKDTTLFINLLPCPSCARMFTETPIKEFVYIEDHSAGYAVQLLEKAGKTVRRVIPGEVAL